MEIWICSGRQRTATLHVSRAVVRRRGRWFFCSCGQPKPTQPGSGMNPSPLKAAGRTRSTPAIGIATNGFTAPNCCPESSRSSVAAEPAKDGWVVTDTVDERPSVAQSRSAGTEALNPLSKLHVERFGSTCGIGNHVMQVENDYEGGLQRRRRRPENRSRGIGDGDRVTYRFGELDEVVLAYAGLGCADSLCRRREAAHSASAPWGR